MAAADSTPDSREVLERMTEIMRTGQLDRLEEVLSPDFIQEIPQSGDRVRGIANFRKVLESMPGMGATPALGIQSNPYVFAQESHYMMTPTFNVVKVDGGDQAASYVKVAYPDGSQWYIVTFTTVEQGKVSRRVDFFAPFFDAPAWRADWVEPMGPSAE